MKVGFFPLVTGPLQCRYRMACDVTGDYLGHYIADQVCHCPYIAIEADDPLHQPSDRTPLTGNISSDAGGQSSRQGGFSSSYLTSSIPGEDRRAPQNTIDESVWETLSRDLLAVWEKMRQVLWPKYLLGGMLQRGGGGIAGTAERGEMTGFGNGLSGLRNLAGRWPDADVVLQGGMSEGLRDWDLWYVAVSRLFLHVLFPVHG